MKRRLSYLLIITLLSLALLAGCASSEKPQTETPQTETPVTEEKDTFVVGMEAGYPPFNWTQMNDSNGGVKLDGAAEYAGGYDVEIAKIIAEGLGKELVVVKTEWDGLVPALLSGKIDAITAGMSPTPERKETIDFSDIYYSSNFIMVVKKGGAYENATSIQDFSGAKVTGQLNTSHYSVIDQIDGVVKEPAFDNFTAMRVALESGIIDAYVSERPEGVSASAANENYVMVEFEDGKGFVADPVETSVAVGILKDSELTAKINEILAGISEEERQEIMDNAVLNQPAAN